MADARIVSRKLEQIERYHSELQKKQQELTRDDLFTNTTEQRAVERMFENVIQACSDLAKHIAAQDFEDSNETAANAIRVLCKENIIDSRTMQTLVSAIGFRNILAHEYGNVDYAEVYHNLQSGLDVFNDFSQQIAVWHQNTE